MVGLLSIKIKIGDREYPMKVEAQDEHTVRNAARIINDRLRKYKEQYGLTDKTDLLALVAFDTTMDQIRLLQDQADEQKELNRQLQTIVGLVSSNS
jgi:cell division protein ZapA